MDMDGAITIIERKESGLMEKEHSIHLASHVSVSCQRLSHPFRKYDHDHHDDEDEEEDNDGNSEWQQRR